MAASRPSRTKPEALPRAGAARRAPAPATRAAPVPPTGKAAAVATPTPRVTAQAAASAASQDKNRKMKLVRDSFTMPKGEYAAIDALKARAARLGRPAKKSEMLRAGVQVLTAMPDAQFLASLSGLAAIKTGRPAKPKP